MIFLKTWQRLKRRVQLRLEWRRPAVCSTVFGPRPNAKPTRRGVFVPMAYQTHSSTHLFLAKTIRPKNKSEISCAYSKSIFIRWRFARTVPFAPHKVQLSYYLLVCSLFWSGHISGVNQTLLQFDLLENLRFIRFLLEWTIIVTASLVILNNCQCYLTG